MTLLHINTFAILTVVFVITQALYFLALAIDAYLFSRPIDRVDPGKIVDTPVADLPHIVLFYPVLRELEDTMRTTFVALTKMVYPKSKFEVVAIPNADDHETIAALRRLELEFEFLRVLEVPPTSDPSWSVVWSAWWRNPKAYWWHQGRRARNTELPPKKTRQLIYALYHTIEAREGRDFLVNYIDADSAPPPDHLLAGAAGMQEFDVLQATNVAGNLDRSLASAWHAFDHMAWDGLKYRHLSANGRHPYWVLGKGLFFRASDLDDLGGFHPWMAIEDPEVGMRFWANGKRLGIIENPLIEEVPATFARGITQRKRWVCGFFQSLGEPLDRLGFTPMEKLKAWLNFLPCMSLVVNVVGIPIGAWALWTLFEGRQHLPSWTLVLAAFNLVGYALSMATIYVATWRRTKLVLDRRIDRILYMAKVNPLFDTIWWMIWSVSLAIGLRMFLLDDGLIWERTEKIDANHALIRVRSANLRPTSPGADAHAAE
jgi:cellulose synthase/poly-beta-1,6-N-acetylglucosamine synthase-like glycosyltransferase